MSFLLKGSRSHCKLKPLAAQTRSVAVHAFNLGDEVADLQVSEFTMTPDKPSSSKVDILSLTKQAPSEVFLRSLSEIHNLSLIKDSKKSNGYLFRKRLFELLASHKYMDVANLISTITGQDSTFNWQSVISTYELSGILKLLINHQYKMMNTAVTSLYLSNNKSSIRSKMEAPSRLKYEIRRIYSNLLYSNPKDHIYSLNMRSSLYNTKELTGYRLSVNDYENLICLELNNLKKDLAAKWFQRFENEFPNGDYKEHMTHKLWVYRLVTYSGGSQALWSPPITEFNKRSLHVRKSGPSRGYMLYAKNWRTVLAEYVGTVDKNVTRKEIFDDLMNETLVYAIGYSKEFQYLEKFIESMWGITPSGKVSDTFKRLDEDNCAYPSINTLKAILASFLYNDQFSRAMMYVNAFQEHYSHTISLSDKSSKSFWDNVFKWADMNTRFDDESAFEYYLAHTTSKPAEGPKITLEDAKKDAEFDYERYLTLIDDLKKKRSNTMEQLWNLFTETNKFFTLRSYNIYLHYLLEIKSEDKLYDYMSLLLAHYNSFHTSSNSFNRSYMNQRGLNDLDKNIKKMYEKALRGLIDHKWQNGNANQCEYLIRTWAIDESMIDSAISYYRNFCITRYNSMVRENRRQRILEEETLGEDKLLDLF